MFKNLTKVLFYRQQMRSPCLASHLFGAPKGRFSINPNWVDQAFFALIHQIGGLRRKKRV
ncbi:MAG: hypothetical protein A3E85_02495 [Gammaproteobacteria bacterium RIFCSPHIGHO2_12_FULL_45_12]|nr:MAG: hypothetical protein A3E85_02495 [Gammaproteobacteria bacterium RIFCSPHIGHO2_12_FULL_45_12]